MYLCVSLRVLRYIGLGLFALLCVETLGVEGSPSACEDAVRRAFEFADKQSSVEDRQRIANKIETATRSLKFEDDPSAAEIKLMNKLRSRSPLFKAHWERFGKGYHRLSPGMRQVNLQTFSQFLMSIEDNLQIMMQNVPGLVQQSSRLDRPLRFLDFWSLVNMKEWLDHSQDFQARAEQEVYLDSNLIFPHVDEKARTFSRSISFMEFRNRLFQGLGMDSDSAFYFTPTAVREIGGGRARRWGLYGRIDIPQKLNRSLEKKDLETVKKIAKILMKADVGRSLDSSELYNNPTYILEDAWMLAEAAYFGSNPIFATMDRRISSRISKEAKENNLKNLEIGLEGYLEFIVRTKKRYIPVHTLKFKVDSGETYQIRFLGFRGALPVDASPPTNILFR